MISSPARVRRRENLPLIYQEVLTAIVRLRSNRQTVSNPEAFRHYIREALKTAARQASAVGFSTDDIRAATFAVVAFLDESVLNSQKPLFEDWLRKPLQEELFGTHVAGDVFFENLQQLLARSDSTDLADLLEIHYLCLLLGFAGRYNANRGEMKQVKDSILEKITRTRGPSRPLASAAIPPAEELKSRKDPWIRILAVTSAACFILMLALFGWYKISLQTAITSLRKTPAQIRK
jgi:type VI secretion system protein ImpK